MAVRICCRHPNYKEYDCLVPVGYLQNNPPPRGTVPDPSDSTDSTDLSQVFHLVIWVHNPALACQCRDERFFYRLSIILSIFLFVGFKAEADGRNTAVKSTNMASSALVLQPVA